MEDEIEYCEKCTEPLTDEDDVYEGICNFCGDKNKMNQFTMFMERLLN